MSLRSVDPSRSIAAAIPDLSVIGCVVHCGASCPEPGLVRACRSGGSSSASRRARRDRATRLAQALTKAGFGSKSPTASSSEIWYKLWGNMTMNPVSALTGALRWTGSRGRPRARVSGRVMAEARRIGPGSAAPSRKAAKTAWRSRRGSGPSRLRCSRTSRRAERSSSTPSSLRSRRSASWSGSPRPYIDAMLGLTRLKARTNGLYPRNLSR